MIYISHRGNLNGINKNIENLPEYLEKIIPLYPNIIFEIDMWLIDEKLWLGHDFNQYVINNDFLNKYKERIICHAKNIDCLEYLIQRGDIHCFFHNNDDVVLTSKNWLWTFPGKKLTSKSICVLPEWNDFKENTDNILGICSDYILDIYNKNR